MCFFFFLFVLLIKVNGGNFRRKHDAKVSPDVDYLSEKFKRMTKKRSESNFLPAELRSMKLVC